MWIEKIARLSCITKSTVYFLLSWLRMSVLMSNNTTSQMNANTSTVGALEVISVQPFGRLIQGSDRALVYLDILSGVFYKQQ